MNNQACYIVGGGPSLKNFDWSLLDNKFVIALNRAYEILPNANIVYFTDNDWWNQHKENLLKHSGKRIKGSVSNSPIKHPQVEEYLFSPESRGFETKPGYLRHGYNSGCAVINLVVAHLGFKEVYLLGYDMKWKDTNDKSTSHWHSGYEQAKMASTVYKTHMLESFPYLLPMLEQFSAKVFNVCPDSELNTFPKLNFEQVFGDKYQHDRN